MEQVLHSTLSEFHLAGREAGHKDARASRLPGFVSRTTRDTGRGAWNNLGDPCSSLGVIEGFPCRKRGPQYGKTRSCGLGLDHRSCGQPVRNMDLVLHQVDHLGTGRFRTSVPPNRSEDVDASTVSARMEFLHYPVKAGEAPGFSRRVRTATSAAAIPDPCGMRRICGGYVGGLGG